MKENKTHSDISTPDHEISEFHHRFRPFLDRIYRGALILTQNSRHAEKLRVDIYQKAFLAYLQAKRIGHFEKWLMQIVDKCFVGAQLKSPSCQRDDLAREQAINFVMAETAQ